MTCPGRTKLHLIKCPGGVMVLLTMSKGNNDGLSRGHDCHKIIPGVKLSLLLIHNGCTAIKINGIAHYLIAGNNLTGLA